MINHLLRSLLLEMKISSMEDESSLSLLHKKKVLISEDLLWAPSERVRTF